MTRYFFVILIMALIGVAIVVKAGVTMFAERQYWQDVADRFVKENVTVKPNRGNIISSDGKLMASSLPEYRIYMDFMSGEKDEKRRKKDQARRDSILKANMDSICIGLHKIFPDRSAAQFKAHLQKGRQAKSRNYLIYPKRISYIQYKEVKRLPVFCLNRYKGGFKELAYNQRKKPFGSLAARTLGDVYADTAQGAKNGIELAFDTILKGRDGLTHRQKVMNKYLNIVDVAPIDGCDLITTIDVGMQDICEKALVDKLKELNATVGVVVLMEVTTGEVKAIVNMTQGRDGEYYEVRNNAISDMLEPGSTFKTASIMVASGRRKNHSGLYRRYRQRAKADAWPCHERPQLASRRIRQTDCYRDFGSIVQCRNFQHHRELLRKQPAEVCRRTETDEHRPATPPANIRRRKTEYSWSERTLFLKNDFAVDEYRL